MSEAQVAAQRAKVASAAMAKASTELKNKALFAMAAALRKEAALICAENAVDCAEARKAGTKDSLIDRLAVSRVWHLLLKALLRSTIPQARS